PTIGVEGRVAAESHAVALVPEDQADLEEIGIARERCLELRTATRDLRETAVLDDHGADRREAIRIAVPEAAVLRRVAQVIPVLARELDALVESARCRAQ